MRTNLTRTTVAAVLLTVTLGAACGGDDSSDPAASSDDTSSSTSAAAAETTSTTTAVPSRPSGPLTCTGAGELTTPEGVIPLDVSTMTANYSTDPEPTVAYRLQFDEHGGGRVNFDTSSTGVAAVLKVQYGGTFYTADPSLDLDIRLDGADLDLTTITAGGTPGPELVLQVECE